MRELEIGPREQKWFAEWAVARKHPPMKPAMRRHTSLHEAAHAVSAWITLRLASSRFFRVSIQT